MGKNTNGKRTPIRDAMTARLSFLLSGLVCAVGVIGAVYIATWRMLLLAMRSQSFPAVYQWWLLAFSIIGVLGLVFLLVAACSQHPPKPSDGDAAEQTQEERRVLYHRYLAGIGFAILLLTGALFTGLGGIAFTDALGVVFDFGGAGEQERLKPDHVRRLGEAIALMIAFVAAVLGACVFFALRLWKKMNEDEEFSSQFFWAGLWFRLGVAVFFTIVIYLVLLFSAVEDEEATIAVLATFLGFSLKSSEQLVRSIAERLQAIVAGALPENLAKQRSERRSPAWDMIENYDPNQHDELIAKINGLPGVDEAKVHDPDGQQRSHHRLAVFPAGEAAVQRDVEAVMRFFDITYKRVRHK